MVTTPFTTFAFPATGSPTSRNTPDRLAEVKNVLDFGADPTGTHDCGPAIQAAIDWRTTDPNRGTIFFPAGGYKIQTPITFNGASIDDELSIRFLGVGGGSNLFTNSFPTDAYIFDRRSDTPNNTKGLRIFQGLGLQNGNDSGGCIRIGSTNGAVIRDCTFSGFNCVTTEDDPGVSSQNIMINNCTFVGTGSSTLGGSNVTMGGSGVVMGCDSRNNDTSYRVYGRGFHYSGGRVENSNIGFLLGKDSADTDQAATGFTIQNMSFEGDRTEIWMKGPCSGFSICSCGGAGHDAGNSGYPIGVQASQFGLRIDADMARNGVIQSLSISSVAEVACISIANATSRTNLVLLSCDANQAGGVGGTSWILPTNAYTASFVNCNRQPIWLYSQLPTGGNIFEGDEFDISDSTTATWGANVTTGGGSNRVKVRYNGTNWTVIGK